MATVTISFNLNDESDVNAFDKGQLAVEAFNILYKIATVRYDLKQIEDDPDITKEQYIERLYSHMSDIIESDPRIAYHVFA
jgi:hypothetical protein